MNDWVDRVAQSLQKKILPVSRFFLRIGQFILVLMVLTTVVDVFLRYLFNSPILGSYELTEFMMAILVFGSVAYTMVVKGHVTVDLVITRLPARAQAILECITCFIAFLLFGMATYRNVIHAKKVWERNDVSAELFIPISPFVLFVAIGIAVLSLVLLVQSLESFARAVKK